MNEKTFEGDALTKLKSHAYEELEKMRPPEGTPALSTEPTPYAVLCREHGQQFLPEDEYGRQLCRPDACWMCPICRDEAQWDDDNYEEKMFGPSPEEA